MKLAVKYIPLAFSKSHRRITIEVSQAVRSRELSAAVSQQIGRDVRVILGTPSYEAYMNWTVADDAISAKSEILAFETTNCSLRNPTSCCHRNHGDNSDGYAATLYS